MTSKYLQVLFVVVMEVLQFVGLLVAEGAEGGSCEHPLNGPVTNLAYLHVCLQPWFYNEWQWALRKTRGEPPFSDDHQRLVRVLAWCFAVGMAARAVPCWAEPCFYCSAREHFCAENGEAACTHAGRFHAFWRLPLRPNNYLWPGLWGHFAVCFLPSAANGDAYDRAQTMLLFATGGAAAFVVAYWGNPATAFDEGPALWCLVAIPQHAVTFAAAVRHRRATRNSRVGPPSIAGKLK